MGVRVRFGKAPASAFPHLFEHALVEPQNPVHLGGDPLVVGGDQGGAAFLADQAEEFGEDDVGGGLVEIAGGLVGEDQSRAVGERAGDRDALLLAAGELARAVGQPLGEAERAEQGFGALPASPRVAPRTSCGRITFSSALKSGSRWWN